MLPLDTLPSAITCSSCGEACAERRISLSLPRSTSGIAVVNNVPADVCQSCGETQFSLRTTLDLMRIVREQQPAALAVVPIYEMPA